MFILVFCLVNLLLKIVVKYNCWYYIIILCCVMIVCNIFEMLKIWCRDCGFVEIKLM